MNKQNFILLRSGGDIDCLLNKNKILNVKKEFQKKDFVVFKNKRKTFHAKKFFPVYKDYHFYIGGIPYNKITLLDQKYFFKEKKISHLLGLLLHLIVDKKSLKGKRKNEIYSLFEKLNMKERKKLLKICEKEYGVKISKKIENIFKKRKTNIKKLKWAIIYKKANFLQLMELPFVLFSNQIYKSKQKRKKYIIAFMGVDGSGKTTTISNLKIYLDKNNIKYEIGNLGVYHERSWFMKILSIFFKKEKDLKKAQENLNINYTKKSVIKNILRTIDIWFRYKKVLKNAKKNKSKIILFDRYFYDLVLQSKQDFITRSLLKIVPKPNKLFFLHAAPETIFKRKRERNPLVLKEQINKFRKEITIICKVKEIKTITPKQTLEEILKELNNKELLTCI